MTYATLNSNVLMVENWIVGLTPNYWNGTLWRTYLCNHIAFFWDAHSKTLNHAIIKKDFHNVFAYDSGTKTQK
jgi:hypothetical protein